MKLLQIIKEDVVPLSGRQNLVLVIIIACLFQFALFYAPAMAEAAVKQAPGPARDVISVSAPANEPETMVYTDSTVKEATMDSDAAIIAYQNQTAALKPETDPKSVSVLRESTHVITAYNSEVAQTDDDPCTTANGFNVCQHNQEDTIAANFLKFGTKVRIPEIFGDRVFVVRDRMNSRYANHVDVWMKDHGAAVKFGVQVAMIQVIK